MIWKIATLYFEKEEELQDCGFKDACNHYLLSGLPTEQEVLSSSDRFESLQKVLDLAMRSDREAHTAIRPGDLVLRGAVHPNFVVETGNLKEAMLNWNHPGTDQSVVGAMILLLPDVYMEMPIWCIDEPAVNGSWANWKKGLSIKYRQSGFLFLPRGESEFITVTPLGEKYGPEKYTVEVSVDKDGAISVE